MSNIIAINELKPGMVIVRITQQNGPVKIRKSGLVTSDDMVNGLAEMGVLQVEIDPDQTVELEPEVAVQPKGQTQTQALLKGQYDRQGHYDKHLADQFNRNLFLPSVQGIPSLWMVYLRQAAVLLLVILLGGSFGFAGATYSLWWPSASDNQLVQNQEETPALEVPFEQESATETKVDDQQTQVLANIQQQLAALNDKVENVKNERELPTNAQLADELDEQEGVELTGQPSDDSAPVSPELLRRFNQAIESLDSEVGSIESNETKVTVRDDIQRIDQLPVRLMTTLPTMSFSAHMYASRPSDRWVRVNGQRKQEGDWIDDKVQIVNIEPQRVILDFEGEIFSMAALTDW